MPTKSPVNDSMYVPIRSDASDVQAATNGYIYSPSHASGRERFTEASDGKGKGVAKTTNASVSPQKSTTDPEHQSQFPSLEPATPPVVDGERRPPIHCSPTFANNGKYWQLTAATAHPAPQTLKPHPAQSTKCKSALCGVGAYPNANPFTKTDSDLPRHTKIIDTEVKKTRELRRNTEKDYAKKKMLGLLYSFHVAPWYF